MHAISQGLWGKAAFRGLRDSHSNQLVERFRHCLLLCLCAAHILSAVDPATGKPLDDAHAKGEIAIFMAAGFETTSHAITWSLTLLVRATTGSLAEPGPSTTA